MSLNEKFPRDLTQKSIREIQIVFTNGWGAGEMKGSLESSNIP